MSSAVRLAHSQGNNTLHYGPKQPYFPALIIHFPTFPLSWEWVSIEQINERSGAQDQSKECGASEWVSDARERANGRASGPVLTSRFLAVLDHSAVSVCKPVHLSVCFLVDRSKWVHLQVMNEFLPVISFCQRRILHRFHPRAKQRSGCDKERQLST